MATAEVIGSVHPLGTGYRAVLRVSGLDDWTVVVDTENGVLGERIIRLELSSDRPDAILTAADVRNIAPIDLLHAMREEWVLEGEPVQLVQPVRLVQSVNSGRARRDDDYLVALSLSAVQVQGTVASTRRALAERFGRTDSQIRDDLHRARQRGYLMPSEPGTRRVQVGPKLEAHQQPTPKTKRPPRSRTPK